MMRVLTLLCVVTFFLPYTDCLVYDIGFPLKIYEVLAILLGFLIAIKLLARQESLRWDKYSKPVYLALIGFVLWYTICGLISFCTIQTIAIPSWAIGRFAPIISGITKILYLFLNVFIFYAVITYANSRDAIMKMMAVWIVSSLIVSLYAFYLFLSSLADWPLFLLPGMKEAQYITIPGIGVFMRNITFKEGNFYGGYIVSSLFMSLPFLFNRERGTGLQINSYLLRIIVLMQLVALFIAYSTIHFIVFFITLMFFVLITFVHGFKMKRKALVVIAILLTGVVAFMTSRGGQLIIYEKLVGNNEFWSSSKKERLESVMTAINMANSKPIFGVGPTNYGLYYEKYRAGDFSRAVNVKRIVNNIYAEIASETGMLGLVFFLLFVGSICRLFGRKIVVEDTFAPISNGLFSGFIAMLLTYLAFPTFTLTFYWVLMGLFVSSVRVMEGEAVINGI